jgi:hypothetical protein
MYPRSLYRYVALFVIALTLTSTAFSQTHITNKNRTKVAREIPIRLAPDTRSPKMPGSTGRDERTQARKYEGVKQEKDDKERKKGPDIGKLKRAGSFDGDLRGLPLGKVRKRERPELEGPEPNPMMIVPSKESRSKPSEEAPLLNLLTAAAPAPSITFDGLDNANWGAGHPPDTNGDVGPTYYIQTINSSIGIFNKTTGVRVAAFTFDTFMSQGNFGNLCDTENFGDPVVLYDTFEDRWVLTDFAFTLSGGSVVNPPGSFQCFAVSKTGDPVSGGWNFYSINTAGGLGDYPKFGIWPDGIYMSTNMFTYSETFQNPRVYAFNKSQMYAGAPTVQVLSFDAPSADFTLLPSNARLQTGTPPAGSPNYYVSTGQFLNAASVYKFHVDWNHPSLSTFADPSIQLQPTCWPNQTPANAPTPANALDVLATRAMVQNQYSNISGAESLWVAHTVQRGESATNSTCNAATGGNATPRWYQLNVTGGTIAANMIQGKTWDPDGANTFFRYAPSVAVNRNGDLAIGYTKSNSTTNPQIKYAGRLAGDPLNTFSQTEQTLIDGTGSQNGTCGDVTPCSRWGDYSAMTLDPDGCTFWYTNEYYATNGLNHLTRVGAFSFPGCSVFANNGGLQGTVKSAVTNQPLQGATVSLGSRSTLTDASGHYAFAALPQGLYLSESASLGGYITATASNLAVTDGNVATQNFTLAAASDNSCFTDTTQSDFQTGTINNTDLNATPGDVKLSAPDVIDQKNESVSPTGFGFTNAAWAGQTFTPAVSGPITRIDVELFCSGCSGTDPNITVSIRATTGTTPVPTGADLATATLTGFNDGAAGGLKTVTFSSPLTVTAGTRYALIFRSTAARTGTYAYTCSCATTGFLNTNPYANGQRVTSSNSGASWTADTTVGGRDLNFSVYINPGYTSGDFLSGVKDSNPAVAGTTTWGSLAWTATVPANTTLQFQAAASNSPYGPFNFVGPNGTSATFFTNGASLSQFNGFRFLKYKALLATTNGAVTPTLSEVTICNTNPRVWTGAVSSDWNNPANWSNSGVPGPSDAATIPSTGVLNNPVSGTNVTVNKLLIGDNRIVNLGSNSLTVTDCSTAAVTGGNTNSFVKGKLIRCVNGSGDYVYPVGTAAGYAPVTLTAMVGTGTFTVNPVDGVLTGVDPANSIHRYWDLIPSGVTQATIKLSYQPAEFPGGPVPEANYKFLRNNGSGTLSFAADSSDTSNPTLHTFTLNNVIAFSSWSIGTTLAPTAAPASVSGRVVSSSGMGVRNAIVSLQDGNGSLVTARTNTFGYFQFNSVQTGQTYVLSVQAKGYTFAPKALSLTSDLTDLIIYGN